jgi:hypothetical protein
MYAILFAILLHQVTAQDTCLVLLPRNCSTEPRFCNGEYTIQKQDTYHVAWTADDLITFSAGTKLQWEPLENGMNFEPMPSKPCAYRARVSNPLAGLCMHNCDLKIQQTKRYGILPLAHRRSLHARVSLVRGCHRNTHEPSVIPRPAPSVLDEANAIPCETAAHTMDTLRVNVQMDDQIRGTAAGNCAKTMITESATMNLVHVTEAHA